MYNARSQQVLDTYSYKPSLFRQDHIARKYLRNGVVISILTFSVFKLLYPYPDFSLDSSFYIYGAQENLNINTVPIGYSKFIALLHVITHSSLVLVALQFSLLQISLLLLFFTIYRLLPNSEIGRTILFYFIVVNPFSLYISNTIDNIAILTALTIFWLIQLLQMSWQPKLFHVIINAVLLFLCFVFSTATFIFLLIASLAFIRSTQPNWRKGLGIILPLTLIVPFCEFTLTNAEKTSGTRQLSFFTGWQLANNSLYIYDQVDADSEQLSSQNQRDISRGAIQFIRTINPDKYRSFMSSYAGDYFTIDRNTPLKQYFYKRYQPKSQGEEIKKFGEVAPTFLRFGINTIKENPIQYILFYVRPNVKKYFFPPLGTLAAYNFNQNHISDQAKKWFSFPTVQVRSVSGSLQRRILFLYVLCSLLFSGYYLFVLLINIRGTKYSGLPSDIRSIIWLLTSFLLLNLIFNSFYSGIELRHQFVPIIAALFGAVVMKEHQTGKVKNLSLKSSEFKITGL